MSTTTTTRAPKFHLLRLALLCLLSFCIGCEREIASASNRTSALPFELLELRYQGNASAVSFPELAEDLGYLAPVKLKHVGNTISGPQDIQAAVTGDVDFGAAFNGAIIKLVTAKAPLRAVIGMSFVDQITFGGFYVLEDSPIRSARDLLGKTVAMNTIGAHSEFVLREYLTRNGLTAKQIAQVAIVVLPPIHNEQALRQRQVEVATLSGITRDKARERGGIRPLFTDYELFGTFTSASYVLTERFIAQHPNTARQFVSAVAKAIEWSRDTPRAQVIERMHRIIERRGRNEDFSLVNYWQPTHAETRGGALSDAQFQLWIDWLVRDGSLKQGQLTAAALYTNQFNPFALGRLHQDGP